MTVLGDWIRELSERSGLTQTEFANRVGSSQPNVSRWIAGSEPKQENMIKLEEMAVELGLPTYTELRKSKRVLEIKGKVGAGAEVFPFDDPTEEVGFDEIEAPAGLTDAIGLIVKGPSMWPVYHEGDIIVVENREYVIDTLLNDECFVRLQDGRSFLKIIKRGSKPGHYTLSSHNAPDIEDVVIDRVAPVIWIKRNKHHRHQPVGKHPTLGDALRRRQTRRKLGQ